MGWLLELDRRAQAWMERYGVLLLRISMAIVFIWFGVLKPFGVSPAEPLVRKTVAWMPVSGDAMLIILGWWEVAIGICFLYRPLIRLALTLMAIQMVGAFMPLVVLPADCYVRFPYQLTMEGQYIIKNLVLIAAAIVIAAHTPPAHIRCGTTG